MITRIHNLLSDWFQWASKVDYCGFPDDYDVSKPRSSLPGHCIVPEGIEPPRGLIQIDRALRVMRENRRKRYRALHAKYSHSGDDQERAEIAGMSVGTFRREVDMAHEWVAGYLDVGE